MLPFFSSNLGIRTLTGAVLGLVVCLAWYFGGFLLFALIAAAAAMAQWECYGMFMKKDVMHQKITGLILGFLFLAGVFLSQGNIGILFMGAVLLAAIVLLFVWEVDSGVQDLASMLVVLAGLAYIPFLLSPSLLFSPVEQLLVVLLPCVADSAAYLVGTKYGKHKIWRVVSPKKSIEGSAASLAAFVLGALLFGIFLGTAPWYHFIWMAIFVGIMAQLGDFFESILKRSVGVKDSGNLLPGHGGVLDRLDSILFTIGSYALCNSFVDFF